MEIYVKSGLKIVEEMVLDDRKKEIGLKKWQEDFGELWNADPNCFHEEDTTNMGGGIKCKHCSGWYCL
jgi:hypothetical protein